MQVIKDDASTFAWFLGPFGLSTSGAPGTWVGGRYKKMVVVNCRNGITAEKQVQIPRK